MKEDKAAAWEQERVRQLKVVTGRRWTGHALYVVVPGVVLELGPCKRGGWYVSVEGGNASAAKIITTEQAMALVQKLKVQP